MPISEIRGRLIGGVTLKIVARVHDLDQYSTIRHGGLNRTIEQEATEETEMRRAQRQLPRAELTAHQEATTLHFGDQLETLFLPRERLS